MTLQEMMGVSYYPSPQNTVYFQILEMSLREFEAKQIIRMSFVDTSMKEQGPFEIFEFKTKTLNEVIQTFLEQIKKDENGSGKYRLYEVVNFRIYKTCLGDEMIQSIPYQSVLFIEVYDFFLVYRKFLRKN